MKNLKKTLKKFRKVRLSLSMKIISLLSCLALVSMGFASWWIIKVDTGTTMGSFTTYEVEKKNVKITNFKEGTTALTANQDGKFEHKSEIIFGKPADLSGTTYQWLRPMDKQDEDHEQENLSFTYTFDLFAQDEKTSSYMNVKDIVDQITLTLTPSAADNFKSAISKDYITSPTITYKIGTGNFTGTSSYDNASGLTTLEIDVDGNTAITVTNAAVTVEVKIEFAWGDAFKPSGATAGVNPYIYFNNLEVDSYADTAYTQLGELDSLMGEMTYEITYDITLQ